MPNDPDSATSRRFLKVAAIAFAGAFGLHGLDHLLRGMTASPMPVMVGGFIQGIFVVIALVLILREHPLARPAAIVVGFGSATLFVYAHLLPTFLDGYQDSFVSGPRFNVTWYSWFTAVAEIGTGLILGYVGMRSSRARLPEPESRLA
ncbi:hypothetical protein [Mycobacterium sp.]|uniref:hypothetical protein n=1 Tax=Mycobacterium sp. TaxID=1785 RepID=UPI002DADDACB|nr:hypothetical protein [Mycobacterium sp.]